MNATYCDGNYANEFSIDFPFSLQFQCFEDLHIVQSPFERNQIVDDEKSAIA